MESKNLNDDDKLERETERTETFEKLEELEKTAQKVTNSSRWKDVVNAISVPEMYRSFSWNLSDCYPALKQLGVAQSALNAGVFKYQTKLEKEIEAMCEPFRSAQTLYKKYDTAFSGLSKMNPYTKSVSDAINTTLTPALNIGKPDISGISTALASITAIDTSWMRVQPSWMTDLTDILVADSKRAASSGLAKLFDMEKETGRILGGAEGFTSVATQLAAINKAFSDSSEKWKSFVVPSTLVESLQSIAIRQHSEIQKNAESAKWHLGVIESASRFADRQITWTEAFLSGLQSDIEVDVLFPTEQDSAISVIPQYIGYTNRAQVDITPEEGFEKSLIVEITEKGKRIVENVVKINNLAEAVGKNQLFRYTGKMMIVASSIGSLFCATKENFGKLIDGFYMMFYENLEHIKSICSEEAVKEEEVYQCIFRVKHIRTDLRHDYEHGENIKKKRRIIADCYNHYTNKPVLVRQKDYVTLQNRMYDEFLALQEHIIEMLLEASEAN